MNELLNVNEVTAILGIHRDTLYRWGVEGKLKPVKTDGYRKFYDAEELRKFVQWNWNYRVITHPIKWIFDTNTIGQGGHHNFFMIADSYVNDLSIGMETYDHPCLLNLCETRTYCYVSGWINEELNIKPCLKMIASGHQYENLPIEGGAGSSMLNDARFFQSQWSYSIPKDKLSRVYEEQWKHPARSNWDTQWIFVSVPDAMLKSTDVEYEIWDSPMRQKLLERNPPTI
jgi:predicted DNA-binding transcriptional regulator AlpA